MAKKNTIWFSPEASLLLLLARVLVSFAFLYCALGALLNFSVLITNTSSLGTISSEILVILTLLFFVVGSMFLAFGYKTKHACIMLMIALLPFIIMFFSTVTDKLALVGLLLGFGSLIPFFIFGAGDISIDAQKYLQGKDTKTLRKISRY
ncbi:MAG: DoxX family membrane protein [Elusimicrobiaceae bacterium]|jgi:uncharacterized membrane protein YphA (DoxX/SURF4 family)|nr:DoxX family membrane protein [Elusimicrobiaceae bacterium]MBT3954913.1 DoxX family membrane protein [Elusimicrobiaceae bacterium]MBT4008563.1 DoxX family membrane protein [Elusimicrobiaceae bacterium]MBT4402999.1 DoxX family membrane protein [Elusimicrobiaceae bacterium]MBT4439729.1 DoxX family membrane protein [Elusimicrobiaceae bacterium]